MSAILTWLAGKKTYIVAIIAGVVQALVVAGVLDQETANKILAFLGALGLATLRAGVTTEVKRLSENGK